MNNLVAVFRKESSDSFRDGRSVTAALIYSVFGPLIVVMTLNFLARREAQDRPFDLPVAGAAAAPSLLAYLEQRSVRIVQAPSDPESAVRSGAIDLALVIPGDYAERFGRVKPATVRLIHDASRMAQGQAVRRARTLLQGYGREVGSSRLIARGVGPEVAEPVKVEEIDLSTSRSRVAPALGMLSIFLLVAAFVGGMNVAIDVTAGERERGSLEPLLATAATARAVVIGKWMTASLFSLLAVGVSVALAMLVLRAAGAGDFATPVRINGRDALALLAALAPLGLFTAALQMLIAAFSRNYKEAQTWLSLLLFVPMLPGFLFEFSAVETAPWMISLPIVGQQILVASALRGAAAAPAPLAWAIAGAVATLAAAACLAATTRLLRSERILLAR
jgi:sodium transport system permease protein